MSRVGSTKTTGSVGIDLSSKEERANADLLPVGGDFLPMRAVKVGLAGKDEVMFGIFRSTRGVNALDKAKSRMIGVDLRGRDISDEAVLLAMSLLDRAAFAPPAQRSRAYDDAPMPIGFNQTMSQPYMVAKVAQELRLARSDKVLEIGTGSAYQAAVLAELAGEVYSIEWIDELALSARKKLDALGYGRVHVEIGDGYYGLPRFAQYDKIVGSAAARSVPRALEDQLREGGILIFPIEDERDARLIIGFKRAGSMRYEVLIPARYVPMLGAARAREN